MRPHLKSRVQLELLKKLREKKNPLQKGFTLVELMIVVAIVGILSAVALPNFLQARNAAEAGARIGEALGHAKECAVFAASNVGAAPSVTPGTGVAWTTACTAAGGEIEATFTAGAEGIGCLDQKSTTASTTATVAIDDEGAITCTFS